MNELKFRGKVMTITVGLPGSGKTTWAKKAGFDVDVSLDECREALWGSHDIQDGPGGVSALLKKQDEIIDEALVGQKTIVVHNTHPLKTYRTPIIEQARRAGYFVQIVFFDVSPDECRKRNETRQNAVPEEVMNDYVQSLEVPEPGEADGVFWFSELERGFK